MYNLRLTIIEQGYQPGTSDQYPSVQAYNQALATFQTPGSGFDGMQLNGVIENPLDRNGAQRFPELSLRRFPTLIIQDAGSGQLLARLEGSQVTTANILAALRQISTLTQNTSTGQYEYPDGRPLGDNGNVPGIPGGGGSWLLWLVLGGYLLTRN